MALPHLVFLVWCVAIRIFFPSFVKWLAHDTIITFVLSVGYPLFATLSWVHASRHPEKKKKQKNEPELEISTDDNKTTAKSSTLRRRKQATTTKRKDDSQANSKVPAAYSKANLASTRDSASLVGSSHTTADSPLASVVYWLRYWQAYAITQTLADWIVLTPIFGRIMTRYPFFYMLGGELKLFFFVWLFGMERILSNQAKDAFLAQVLPLNLIKRHVTPLLLWLHEKVSGVVSEEQWDRWVVSKAKGMLGALVFIKFLSESTKDWIVHVLEESRAVILPAVTLLMPGFVTSLGVPYVQYIIPSAKSAQAKGDAAKLVYLQYWILNCAVTGLLAWFSGILYWVPLSTHAVFVLWAYLSFPQTIRTYYDVLESELIAFGLMKGNGSSVGISDTKTAKLVSCLTRRLPSASQDEQDETAVPANGLKPSTSEDSVPDLRAKTTDSDQEDLVDLASDDSPPSAIANRRSTRSSSAKKGKKD